MPVSPETLTALQSNSSNIRNICILAHVDHGKTTLSDSLLASNGIVSSKLAGKIRYLDSREDEQLRGITMKSSAISLLFSIPGSDDYLINLIDSPGHIDFASEVSTASRLCDGALVVVDAVEGVCTQTRNVLRQAWRERVHPILIINKLDRLKLHLKLTPTEAYTHLVRVLEQVNAIMGQLYAGDIVEQETLKHIKSKNNPAELSNEAEDEEKDDSNIYFSPEKGNVVFASAADGWAFRIHQFARLYSKKLGMNEQVLRKTLWGDFYLDPKAKRILTQKQLQGRVLKPTFAQLVLENIWQVYEVTLVNPDLEKVTKIVDFLGVKLLPRELRSKDPKPLLSSIITQWLPLSTAVLATVVDQLPSPNVAQKTRMPVILYPHLGLEEQRAKLETLSSLERALYECDVGGPVVAYVSKMFGVPKKEILLKQKIKITEEELKLRGQILRERLRATTASDPSSDPVSVTVDVKAEEEEEEEVVIGFARVYSGTIRVGQSIRVLSAKYDPLRPEEGFTTVTVKALYMIMGKELEPLDAVPAGNVFGISGLEEVVLKTATITDDPSCPSLSGLLMMTTAVVRVALEPENPTEMQKLIDGLHLLNQADPSAEFELQETGEIILSTAGELHLELCLKDLRERYARINVQASAPLVPFRETIVLKSDVAANPLTTTTTDLNEEETLTKACSVKIIAIPLAKEVTKYLNRHVNTIRTLSLLGNKAEEFTQTTDIPLNTAKEQFISELSELLKTLDRPNLLSAEHIWAFGPNRIGPNLLLNPKLEGGRFKESIVTGFQLATFAGPLCAEPMQGVCFILQEVLIHPDYYDEAGELKSQHSAMLSGQFITATKEACKQAFLAQSPRLMMATYFCDILAPTEILGKVYAVLSKRRGKIISEEMDDSNTFFQIKATIPVIESFGFCDEIRTRSSGAASPMLVFQGFEVLDQDPFWVPTTEEELEDMGEKADRENVAKKYMESVRKRKGLFVERKIVLHAEKQRTLKK